MSESKESLSRSEDGRALQTNAQNVPPLNVPPCGTADSQQPLRLPSQSTAFQAAARTRAFSAGSRSEDVDSLVYSNVSSTTYRLRTDGNDNSSRCASAYSRTSADSLRVHPALSPSPPTSPINDVATPKGAEHTMSCDYDDGEEEDGGDSTMKYRSMSGSSQKRTTKCNCVVM
ncbi:hypothetical protein FOZ61_010164 [Perkinsus olseni]|uniref:Uncharacterized protein n=1 Tax=Perkinsus olseni TaxID=32597 RepID=A0A7J6MXM4_PEROL|nr:hypothetical protein FOZ61_010164 [Perkinsus olseni]KAF4675980.1 hypothetical protein FOL46_008591 [Perkinsus olseni]